MSHWPISRLVMFGMGALASIIVMLALAAGLGKGALVGLFDTYDRQSGLAEQASRLTDDLAAAQRFAARYAAAPDPSDAVGVRSRLDALQARLDDLAADPELPADLAPKVRGVAVEVDAYGAAFADLVRAMASRQRAHGQAVETGQRVHETLAGLMNAANRAGDPGQTFSAARVLESFVRAQLDIERFLREGQEGLHETARAHLDDADRQLSWMATTPGDRARADTMAQARSQIADFEAQSAALASGVAATLAARAGLDDSGARVLGLAEDVVARASADRRVVAERVRRTLATATVAMVAVSIATIAGAGALGWRIARLVRREFDVTLRCVGTLAAGDLTVEVPGTGRPTELGQVADALEILRRRGLEAATLARRNEEAKAQAREQERLADERDRAATEAREHAEREVAERRKREIFATLEGAVSGVVAAAARGDFGGRVEVAGLDAGLARLGEEINRLMSSVDDGLHEISRVTGRLASGDLRDGMQGSFEGTFEALQGNIATMIAALADMVRDISSESAGVKAHAADMSAGADDLARRAETQAASLEQTSASMTEIASAAKSNAGIAAATEADARTMNGEADKAREVLAATVAAMRDIEEHSREIDAIVDVIEEIAFQTNLLSLNASVEAARAGEAGKGFAVVANEVRALAQRSAEASTRVQDIIGKSTAAITRGSGAVDETGTALDQIVSRVVGVTDSLRDIRSASEEQATAVGEMTKALAQLDRITQDNAAVAERTRTSAAALSVQSQRVEDAVARVRIPAARVSPTLGSAPRQDEAA